MPRFLSITNLLTVLFFCSAASLYADVTVTPLRASGSSLDVSLQNEVTRAACQAALWLTPQQHQDGSWGESNRVRLTAIILIALKVSCQPASSESCARAALWLDGTATHRIDDLDTHAWRLLAFTFMLPKNPARSNLLSRLAARAETDKTQTPTADPTFWHEALVTAGLASPPPPDNSTTSILSQTAADWPPDLSNNADTWRLIRLINRTGHGQLLRGNTPLDWRTDLARHLITTQRRDLAGGCYWNGDTRDGRIEQTALGILALLEL